MPTPAAARYNAADEAVLTDWLARSDLVLDATDNFPTRPLINRIAWQQKVPIVSGAAIRWEGQVAVFDPRQADSPCYRCLYSNDDGAELNCAENGVVAPLVGIIGTCQALEAIKLLCGVGEPLTGSLLAYDAKYAEWRRLSLPKDVDCPVCAAD